MPLSRRELLALGAAAVAAPLPGATTDENARPGDADWQLSYAKFDSREKNRSPFIEGYCNRTSVRAGETIRFFLSTNEPAKARIDLFRMGYYGGKGARRVKTIESLAIKPQATPEMKGLRLRECQWEIAAEC